jgi:hypothetical protein
MKEILHACYCILYYNMESTYACFVHFFSYISFDTCMYTFTYTINTTNNWSDQQNVMYVYLKWNIAGKKNAYQTAKQTLCAFYLQKEIKSLLSQPRTVQILSHLRYA